MLLRAATAKALARAPRVGAIPDASAMVHALAQATSADYRRLATLRGRCVAVQQLRVALADVWRRGEHTAFGPRAHFDEIDRQLRDHGHALTPSYLPLVAALLGVTVVVLDARSPARAARLPSADGATGIAVIVCEGTGGWCTARARDGWLFSEDDVK